MAVGTPVICYNYGGAPEYVRGNGIVVDTQEELIEALVQFDGYDPVQVRRHVEENYNPEKSLGILYTLVEDVIAGKSWRGWV
jgi:glycosyltransferase involved in cell wall biosynthesis